MTKGAVSQQVTLDSAIAIAMRNSPSLAIFKNVVDIAGINNNYGIAGGLPVVQSVNTVTEQLTSLEQKYSNPLNNKNSKNASSNQLNAGIANMKRALTSIDNAMAIVNTASIVLTLATNVAALV